MKRERGGPVAALLVALWLAGGCGQEPGAGERVYVERLGTDTTAIEAFTRSADRIEGALLTRSPVTRLGRYSAQLAPDGSVQRLEVSWETPAANPDGPPPRHAVLEVRGDSASVGIGEAPESLATVVMAIPEHTLPAVDRIPLAVGLFEQAIRQARAGGGPPYAFTVLQPGSNRGRLSPNSVNSRGPDSVSIDFFGNPMIAAVDEAGRILGVTGREATVKIEVEPVDPAGIDLDALAAEYAARDARGEGFGLASPRGSAEATLDGAMVTIDYGRPSKRGRPIFGALVPWDVVWRTGANAATHLTVDRPLRIGEKTFPAGTYTLWTLLTPESGELIVSSLTDVWGTAYDPAHDLARIPLMKGTLPEVIEQFTMEVEPSGGGGGILALSWDTSRYTVPLEVVRR